MIYSQTDLTRQSSRSKLLGSCSIYTSQVTGTIQLSQKNDNMRLAAFASLLWLVPTTLSQFPTCDPDCVSCGLACDTGCEAPLDYDECSQCLYCRRESSSCGWFELSYNSTDDPDFCNRCYKGCWCHIGTVCYDGIPPPKPTGMGRRRWS